MLPELAPRALWLPSQPGQDSGGWAAGRGQSWEQKAGQGELAGRWWRWDSHSRDRVNPGFPISISAVLGFRFVPGDGSELLPLAQGGAQAAQDIWGEGRGSQPSAGEGPEV